MPEHGQSITFAEYDAIPETTRFTELIGGVLILSPSVTDDHQRTVGNILYLLHEKAPDGEVYPTLTGVYLDDENVVEPDVIWLAKDGHCKVEEQYLVGAPELLIEILSPATAKRDKTIKFALYERFGVDEYWIVDPKNAFWKFGYSTQGIISGLACMILRILSSRLCLDKRLR